MFRANKRICTQPHSSFVLVLAHKAQCRPQGRWLTGNDVYVWITSTRQNQNHRRSLQEQENVTTSNFMAPTWSMEMQQQKQEIARVQSMFYFLQQMKPNASNQGFPFKAPQSIACRREAQKEEALDDLP